MNRLWIVTPVYFDVESFRQLRERILEVLEGSAVAGDGVCFVVLDDSAGRDGSIDELDRLDDVTIVQPAFNLGHQRGLVHALRTLAPMVDDDDVILTLDSDGEDRPEDIPRVLEALPGPGRSEPDEVVLALRTGRRTSLAFKAMYVSFRIMFRLLTGTGVRTGNFAAFRGSVANRLLFHPLFDFSYSSTFLALDVPARYVPCRRGERYAGTSKMGYSRLLLHGIQMLMPFVDRIAMRALALFAIVLAISVALGLTVIGVRVFSNTAIPGWAGYTLLGAAILSVVALGNFVTLFTVYSQTRARSLAAAERLDHGRARVTSTTPD